MLYGTKRHNFHQILKLDKENIIMIITLHHRLKSSQDIKKTHNKPKPHSPQNHAYERTVIREIHICFSG